MLRIELNTRARERVTKEDRTTPVTSEYKRDRDEYTGNYMATVVDQ